jgi:pimeloyl-ACP methyl ester carboxylesterase
VTGEPLRLEASGFTFDALAAGPPGGRLVLLLHGFPQTSRSWRRVMPPLAEAGHRVVAVDQRGYSPEARPEGVESYAMPALVGDVIGFADHLGADRIDLVGHDWGAAVAWQVAARHAERVRSLTAVSVPHPLAFADALRGDEDQQRRAAYVGVLQQEGVAEEKLSADDWAALRRIYGDAVDPADIEHYVATLAEPGALTSTLGWYRAISGHHLKGIGRTTVPTLYVWSTEDAAIGRTAAEATGGHVEAPYRFVELEGVTHWIPDERPEQLAELVLGHLAAT